VIDSSVYYLKTKLKDADQKVQEHLERIKLSVNNSTAIIESLLNLTRMKAPELAKLDLTAVARNAVATSKLPQTMIPELDFPEGEVLVNGDHEQLRMAFKNIIKNANEAMETGGTLTVTIRTVADGWAEVSFADTGSGIAAEDLNRVFEPLFSRKARGIGLGLSITKMIIEKHGGTIEAKSEPGKGATIVIQLPLYADKDKEA
jgi:signal transduction histidine kinase